MQIFFAPDITGTFYTLDENESNHCIRVLRMVKGTDVRLVDGKGNLYSGRIAVPDSRRCQIEITSIANEFEKRPYNLHIGISPLKNSDRFEWFVEKSVEMGIDAITPVICHNTEKKNIKSERLGSIIISAMKQSVKAYATKLNDPVPLSKFVENTDTETRLIAHCNSLLKRSSVAESYKRGRDVVILIGPEGDFTTGEIDIAITAGFCPVELGKSRLRTETAGIVACHSIYFMNQ